MYFLTVIDSIYVHIVYKKLIKKMKYLCCLIPITNYSFTQFQVRDDSSKCANGWYGVSKRLESLGSSIFLKVKLSNHNKLQLVTMLLFVMDINRIGLLKKVLSILIIVIVHLTFYNVIGFVDTINWFN